ncbi:hypothetical protein Patl1_19020 [Pistacia atlantica]|uniref:Uncharacterized protein n=1 Tax=Pistacia atlantica TaxID=434234 RepID=A0ACC1C3F0_9ROSI|nr:hypothetical protein Patl1_19020 [Pistacia atlantica]
MVRISNFIVGFLNCLSLLLGLVSIAMSVYFYVHGIGSSQCEKALENPLLITGIVLLVVSLLGLIGSCCRLNAFLFLYLTVMVCLMIGLLGFTVFTFMVTNNGVGKTFSNKGVSKIRTWDLANWLENHFVKGKKWDNMRSCLRESEICRTSNFYKKNLSLIQSGCCKPPSECGIEQKGATMWAAPKEGKATNNSDCNTWNNQQNKLCYDCNACKEGFLMNIKKQWKYLAVFNLCALVLVILSYGFGSCAMKNNRKNNRMIRKYHP